LSQQKLRLKPQNIHKTKAFQAENACRALFFALQQAKKGLDFLYLRPKFKTQKTSVKGEC